MLTQYNVKWGDKDLILYARDPEDARKQVGAPAEAIVSESHLDEKGLKMLLMKKMNVKAGVQSDE